MTNSPALRRSSRQRIVAGVCAALARRWGVDPLLVRVFLIVATVVTSGIALLAYVALWIVIPLDNGRPAYRTAPVGRVAAALAILVVGTAILVPEARSATIGFALFSALALVWYAVWKVSQRPAPPVAPPPLRSWGGVSDAAHAGGLYPPTALMPPQHGATSYASRAYAHGLAGARPRTWRYVVGGVAVSWLALAAADRTGIQFDGSAYFAAALAVVGLALVGTARGHRAVFGRPRGLVAAGLLLALCTMASVLPDTQASAPTTNRRAFTTAAALSAGCDLATGTHTLDLSGLTLEADRTVECDQEAGQVTVLLPTGVNTRVIGQLGMGQASTPKGTISGMDKTFDETYSVAAGRPTLTLRVHLEMGKIEVLR